MSSVPDDIQKTVAGFLADLKPVEPPETLILFTDNRTGARFYDCHVHAKELVSFATTDVALDPEEQEEYRANREVVTDDPDFLAMKEDAKARRSFSNLVTEYVQEDGGQPLKIIGGQHRFQAIELGLQSDINELHGIKVYFGLTKSQRLDVQLISNTNIDVSAALADRLRETYRGSYLRDWCQKIGLLEKGQDFGAVKTRGGPITVDVARTFIRNFYDGKKVTTATFDSTETTPTLYKSGQDDGWEKVLTDHPDLWKDSELEHAGKEFVKLRDAQRNAFAGQKGVLDFQEKAMNGAVLSAWAYVAGMLQENAPRLARHYDLANTKGKDPLNAAALAEGKHTSDKDNYRGLGYRTDPRERAQMVELFHILAEDSSAVTKKNVQAAIYSYFAKLNKLEAQKRRAS